MTPFLTLIASTKEYRNILRLQVAFNVDPYTGLFKVNPLYQQTGGYTPVPLPFTVKHIAGETDTLPPFIRYAPDGRSATVTLIGKFRLNAAEQLGAAVLNATTSGYMHRAAWVWAKITYTVQDNGKTSVVFSGSAVPNQTDYLDGAPDGNGYDMNDNPFGIKHFLETPYGTMSPPDNRQQ